MARWSARCAAALALRTASLARGQVLDLLVRPDGSYSITHNGEVWLESGETRVGEHSSASGDLEMLGSFAYEGSDALGRFVAQTLRWGKKTNASGKVQRLNGGYPQGQKTDSRRLDTTLAKKTHAPDKVLMETTVRTYPADKGVLLFEQYFPSTVILGAQSNDLLASTLFPAFSRNPGPADKLDCFAYHGVFPGMRGCKVETYSESHQGGTPLVIYNSTIAKLPMLVLAPLTWAKAQHMASTESMFGVGVKSTVGLIPAGWTQLVMLSAGAGIHDGMMAWGDRVLKYHGKPRADMYAGNIVGTIGFWTDNGGYYHYATGSNETYEEVLPRVKAYHDSIGVPFRHWQFDSWFYPKDGVPAPGGEGPGVTNWTAMPDVFPGGMAHIQSLLNVPMVMHNRQWSPRSDYIKNLSFEWYKSSKAAIPKDPPAFFKWFFAQQEGWGLEMYEQDWMKTQYDDTDALQTNITMGDLWLAGMAAGANSSNITVQYCMPYPNDLLSGAAHPAVTNARATGDYLHSDYLIHGNQWAVGSTALFYWALGILPFKDGFYSSTHLQKGGQTEGPEKHPDREAIMATLSCAMVAPMDGINLLNASRVMSTCRNDGVLLKPDEPVVTSEECFRRPGGPAECWTFHAYSNVPTRAWQALHSHYLFVDNGSEPITPGMVNLRDHSGHVVYNWYTRELSLLAETNLLRPGYEGHVYAVVTVVLDGWIFIGEVDKYVTAARIRFPHVAVRDSLSPLQDPAVLEVTVAGSDDGGEDVEVCAAQEATLRVVCKIAHFERAGDVQTLSFEPDAALAVLEVVE